MLSCPVRCGAMDGLESEPWHALCLSACHLRTPMNKKTIRIGIGRSLRTCASLSALILVVVLVLPQDAQAGPRRARVSRDVADRLAQRVEASSDVIVAAPEAAVDQLAVRYGARVKRRITGGAVFEVTGGQ